MERSEFSIVSPERFFMSTSGGGATERRAEPASPSQEPFDKILGVLRPESKRILEVGCRDAELGRRFKSQHPGACWWGVQWSRDGSTVVFPPLDQVVQVDPDGSGLSSLEGGFDAVILGDAIQSLRDPARILEQLYDLCTPGAQMVCSVSLAARASLIKRILSCDQPEDLLRVLDPGSSGWPSQAEVLKSLLDAGWLPQIHECSTVQEPMHPFNQKVMEAVDLLGLGADAAVRSVSAQQLIITCRKWAMGPLLSRGPNASFTVIVAVHGPENDTFSLANSPGLKEVGAEIIPVHGARSAAEAYRLAQPRATQPWHLLVTSNVYFPRGSGWALARQLGTLEAAGKTKGLVGFAGLSACEGQGGSLQWSGLKIDHQEIFQYPASNRAFSVDDMAVAVHRDGVLNMDPGLGWHLWATDLCLQAADRSEPDCVAAVVEVPIFQGEPQGGADSAGVLRSAQQLLEKYPRHPTIRTLYGDFNRTKRGCPQAPAGAGEAVSECTITESYRAAQAALHAQGNYGLAALQYGEPVSELIRHCGARSLLDYGCGSKRSLLKVLSLPPGVRYEGYDPAVPEYSATPKPADLVVCIDVLEHIEPELLSNVLDQLARLCDPFGFFTVHTGPAGKWLPDGRNAHLIQQPAPWWLPQLEERFQILLVEPVPMGFAVVVKSHRKDFPNRP